MGNQFTSIVLLTGPAQAVEVNGRMLRKGTLRTASSQRRRRGRFVAQITSMLPDSTVQRVVLAAVHVLCLRPGGVAIWMGQVNGLAGARRRLDGREEMLALAPVSCLCRRRAIAVDVRGNGGERLLRVHFRREIAGGKFLGRAASSYVRSSGGLVQRGRGCGIVYRRGAIAGIGKSPGRRAQGRSTRVGRIFIAIVL